MNIKDQANIIDLSIRVFCLEKILIDKKILTKEELSSEINLVSETLMKNILKAANYTGDIDQVVNEIKKNGMAN